VGKPLEKIICKTEREMWVILRWIIGKHVGFKDGRGIEFGQKPV
jgi:hypothetical protein